MKKLLLLLLLVSLSFSANAQLAKELYKEFLKYGTFYTAGDINNSYENTNKKLFC